MTPSPIVTKSLSVDLKERPRDCVVIYFNVDRQCLQADYVSEALVVERGNGGTIQAAALDLETKTRSKREPILNGEYEQI